MTGWPTVTVVLLALVAVLGWLLLPAGRGRLPAGGKRDDPDLRAAEAEVRDLDAFTTPDQADDELTDWGPGTSR